jgi:hypothetical protein
MIFTEMSINLSAWNWVLICLRAVEDLDWFDASSPESSA